MKVVIRAAQQQDYELFIVPLISKHPDYLEQERLPFWHEFVVLEFNGKVVGCCALKDYSKKLGEIRSLAFSAWWWKMLFAIALIRVCIGRAKQKGVRQLLVMLGKKYKWLFWLLGFRRFNQEKYAMLKLVSELKPFEVIDIPGVTIEDLGKEGYEAVRRLPFSKEILLDPNFFPDWKELCVAKSTLDGRIIGCCALVVFQREDNGYPEMAEIRTLFVRPEFQGKGIGPALCANRCNLAIKLKVTELLATTKSKSWFEKYFSFGIMRGAEEAWFMVLKNGN